MNIRQYLKRYKTFFKIYVTVKQTKVSICIWGNICCFIRVLISLRSGTFEQIGVPEQYFGVVFAALGIMSGITAKTNIEFITDLQIKHWQ